MRMEERVCRKCGSRIVIDGNKITITSQLRYTRKPVTCQECREWIKQNAR